MRNVLAGTMATGLLVALFSLASPPTACAQAPKDEPPAPAVAAPAAEPETAAPAEEPFSIASVIQELKRQYKAGGATNTFIAFLSILGLAFVLERVFRLRRRAIAPSGMAETADRLWKEGKLDDIRQLCDRHPKASLSKIIRFVLDHRTMPLSEMNAVAGDIAARDIGHHHILAFPLTGVATLAPLLGLYGTVIGMMECFETVAVAGAMGDPTLLASGIAKALVTTAWGLTVAIPTIFFFTLIKFRTNYLGKILEEEASTLINEWMIRKETA